MRRRRGVSQHRHQMSRGRVGVVSALLSVVLRPCLVRVVRTTRITVLLHGVAVAARSATLRRPVKSSRSKAPRLARLWRRHGRRVRTSCWCCSPRSSAHSSWFRHADDHSSLARSRISRVVAGLLPLSASARTRMDWSHGFAELSRERVERLTCGLRWCTHDMAVSAPFRAPEPAAGSCASARCKTSFETLLTCTSELGMHLAREGII